MLAFSCNNIYILCVCVCVSVWYVILEHEDKNVRAELTWRLLIATIKTPIHISQSKFYFHVQRSLKHHNIHIFVSFDVEHNVECRNLNWRTGTVEVEPDMEPVSCAFFLLCLILCMSGWSGCGQYSYSTIP